MRIDPQYRIEAACAEDDTRPVLFYVKIMSYYDQPVAVAADGFIMACVPVEMEYDDVPGLLDPAVIKRARQLTKNGRDALIDLYDDKAGLWDGSTMPRIQRRHTEKPMLAYPDVMKLIERCSTRGKVRPSFAFNPKLLSRAAAAIGWAEGCGPLYVHRDTPSGPLLVALTYQEGIPKPPFALVMPMYVPGVTESDESLGIHVNGKASRKKEKVAA